MVDVVKGNRFSRIDETMSLVSCVVLTRLARLAHLHEAHEEMIWV